VQVHAEVVSQIDCLHMSQYIEASTDADRLTRLGLSS